jgi:hypothetical protein
MDHAVSAGETNPKTMVLQDKRMQLQFVGSGDAFGSGGRFHACFHVTGGACRAA